MALSDYFVGLLGAAVVPLRRRKKGVPKLAVAQQTGRAQAASCRGLESPMQEAVAGPSVVEAACSATPARAEDRHTCPQPFSKGARATD